MSDVSLIDILPRRTPNIAALKRWIGLSSRSARPIDGIDHLRQSILDILTTYPGERIMRPEYGSRLRDLIDRPVNAQWLADLYFEVAYAIHRWEPRVRVLRVSASVPQPGHVVLDLSLRIGGDETTTLRLSKKLDVMQLARVSGHSDIGLLYRVYYREQPEDFVKLLD